MFIWGIFMSHEARDGTIESKRVYDSIIKFRLSGKFATEERALEYLKSQEKWWRDIYNDPCITDAAKKEIFGGKKPDESIRLFKEPAEICGEEDVWVLTRDYISSTGAEMRERIMAKELSVKE